MPKTNFIDGQRLYATTLNALNNMKFVNVPSNDGERTLILDSELDDSAGGLLNRFNVLNNAFTVTAGSGLGFNYTGGKLTDSRNNSIIYTSGSGVVPANVTSFVYITNSVLVGPYLPQECLPLAQVTANATQITGVVNLRPDHPVIVQPRTINREGGTGRDGVFTFAAGNTSLDGVRNFTTVNITGGTIFVVPGLTEWRVQGDCYVNGTIILRPYILGSKGLFGGTVPGMIVPAAAGGVGGAVGHNILPSLPYSIDTSSSGSGGGAGLVLSAGTAAGNILQSTGGDGGGSFKITAVGEITFGPNFKLFVEGGDATPAIMINGGNASMYMGAAGGGSGGGIDVFSFTAIGMTGGGLISVRGGNGSQGAFNAGVIDSCVTGGGAGGGGRVRFRAPVFKFNTVSQVNVITSPGYSNPWSGYTQVIGAGSVPFPWTAANNQNAVPTPPIYPLDSAKLNINISNGFNGPSLYSTTSPPPTAIGYSGVNGVLFTQGVILIKGNNNGVLTDSNVAKTVGAFAGSGGGSFGGSGSTIGAVNAGTSALQQLFAGNYIGAGTVEFITI